MPSPDHQPSDAVSDINHWVSVPDRSVTGQIGVARLPHGSQLSTNGFRSVLAGSGPGACEGGSWRRPAGSLRVRRIRRDAGQWTDCGFGRPQLAGSILCRGARIDGLYSRSHRLRVCRLTPRTASRWFVRPHSHHRPGSIRNGAGLHSPGGRRAGPAIAAVEPNGRYRGLTQGDRWRKSIPQ